MKDITVQNLRLNLQENTLKTIPSLFYTHCNFWPFSFPPLLMGFKLSKMQLVVLKKLFKVPYFVLSISHFVC